MAEDVSMARRAAVAGLIVALSTVAIDQAHKLWSIFGLGMKIGDRYAVTPFLDVIYVINPGISYGLFAMNSFAGQALLSGFAFLVAIGLTLWLLTATHSHLVACSIGLVAGGAVGNAIDRLYLGGVADFFSLHAFGFYWYIFNIADVAIVAGVIGLLYDSLVLSRNRASNQA
ncbi:MAG TPA: signal peptidase II [Hyphomicrobiaceae bacterium]|nr:signal peptidase II [Hyphomicrobiaceae bacterium]